jgi:hypothetical protein
VIKLSPRLQTPDIVRASVPAAHDEPPVSPEDLAETALLAAQVAAWEVEYTEAALDVADDWFAAHSVTDRLYERAVRRKTVLESQRVVQLWMAWTAVSQLWTALSVMEGRDGWLSDNAPEIDAESIESVWRSIAGDRLPPFGVPYPKTSSIAVPAWQREELEERRTVQTMRRA